MSGAAPPGAGDTVTLTVGGQHLVGWQRVAITRPLAAIPASFDFEVTEHYPLAPDIDILPGAPCTVSIGPDLVLTGYVDRYAASVSGSMHSIKVSGRSMSEDLVDCSAIVENTAAGSPSTQGMQIVNGTTMAIVQRLAAPYKVPVKAAAGVVGIPIPQFNINLGETAWEIIDRVTRYSKLLVFDDVDGTLVVSNVGTIVHASGVTVGKNIEAAQCSLSMDQRYQEYEGHLIALMALGTDAGPNLPGVGEIVRDEGVPRFRKKYIISEQFVNGVPIVKDRTIWECNRRKGQSKVLACTIDAWRDSAGKLWTPNMLAPISADVLKITNKNSINWIIGRVSYLRDETGQHAELELMDPIAFSPEPTAPGYLITEQDVNAYNATKANVGPGATPSEGPPPPLPVPPVSRP